MPPIRQSSRPDQSPPRDVASSLLPIADISARLLSENSIWRAGCFPIPPTPPESIPAAPAGAARDTKRLDSLARHCSKRAGSSARWPSRASVRAQSSSGSRGPACLAPGPWACSSALPSVIDSTMHLLLSIIKGKLRIRTRCGYHFRCRRAPTLRAPHVASVFSRLIFVDSLQYEFPALGPQYGSTETRRAPLPPVLPRRSLMNRGACTFLGSRQR